MTQYRTNVSLNMSITYNFVFKLPLSKWNYTYQDRKSVV